MAMPKMKTYQVRYDIPDDLAQQVGHIIVRWAHLEQYAQRLIYKLLRINPKLGRVAVSEPRLEDRIEMIATLAHLRNTAVDEASVTSFKKRIRDVQQTRDLLAHGIWFCSTARKTWMVQLTRGAKPDMRPGTSRHANKRKVHPAGVPMGTLELFDAVAKVDGLIASMTSLERALKASLGKGASASPSNPPIPRMPKEH